MTANDRSNYTHEDGVVEGLPLVSNPVIGTTATPIPATPLAGRNALRIRNPGPLDITICNADGTGAYTLEPSDKETFETRDELVLFYAKAAAPQAIEIVEYR